MRAGELVAVVGPSGAGKSTLMDLVLRFHDPSSGAVRVDGHDLRLLPQRELRQRLGVVTQEPFHLRGHHRGQHPLRLAAAPAARSRAAAARRPVRRLHRAASRWATPPCSGRGGVQLSAGERQRLAIARTLLRDPAIVLLDEPISMLDVEGEIAVQAAVTRLAAGRTTLLVAHRLPATLRADRIVVLEEGRVVEQGPPAELLARAGGRYRRMMRLFRREDWAPAVEHA